MILNAPFLLTSAILLYHCFLADANLILTGVVDGPFVGGIPKAIEMYATTDIADLSIYGLGSANNGGGTDGQEFTFPVSSSARAGQYIYVATESTNFTAFFGFGPNFVSGAANINGDDAIELFANGAVIDTFGDISQSGTGQSWDYMDGWVYRAPGTGPDGGTFVLANWLFSGINALDGETVNSAAANAFPIGTYSDGGEGPGPVLVRKIHEVQGDGDASPLVGEVVTVEGIVTGDFENGDADVTRNLGGFYMQEEDADADGDDLTSEGIFVFLGSASFGDIVVGDRVAVTGTVQEYFGETQLSNIAVVVVQSSGNSLPTPTAVELPSATATESQDGSAQPDLEAYEGMLVIFPEELTVAEQFQLDRFNEIKLVQGERPIQYTQNNIPDAGGYQTFLEELGKRRITYDDGINTQNVPINNLDGFGPNYNNANAIRMGDTITGLSGVLSYQWAGNVASGATWRVRSTQNGENAFTKNPRPPAPSVDGTHKIVSLNVLNYFTSLDDGTRVASCVNPLNEERGADTRAEFDRQTEKLVTAIAEMDADILGLVEIENCFGASSNDFDSAIGYLIQQVNIRVGAGTYAFIHPGAENVGGDAIAVAFIYKPGTIAPQGAAQILDDPAFINDIGTSDPRNRAALAQTFVYQGACMTLAVNHFKSKGSACAADTPATSPTGTGNCDAVRVNAATELAGWLAADPTGQGCASVAILGDLNSYAMETPIITLLNSGYINAEGPEAYSYVFDGQVGTLDYVLLGDMFAYSTDVVVWHINEDEAVALNYNLDFGRLATYFDPSSSARHSDHSPVIVGVNLASAGQCVINKDCTNNANGKYCNKLLGECVACTRNQQCTNLNTGKDFCSPVENVCVECNSSRNCRDNDLLPNYCLDNICVECLKDKDCICGDSCDEKLFCEENLCIEYVKKSTCTAS